MSLKRMCSVSPKHYFCQILQVPKTLGSECSGQPPNPMVTVHLFSFKISVKWPFSKKYSMENINKYILHFAKWEGLQSNITGNMMVWKWPFVLHAFLSCTVTNEIGEHYSGIIDLTYTAKIGYLRCTCYYNLCME